MANGTDTDQFVITTKVKKGLKREFEFAVKSQSEILGTTRRARGWSGQEGGFGNAGASESSEKRLKVEKEEVEVVSEGMEVEKNGVGDSGSEESMKSEIEDPGSDDERKIEGISSKQDGMLVSPVVGGDEVNGQVEAKPLQHYSRMKFKVKVAEVADAGLMNDENSKSETGPGVEKDGLIKVKLTNAPKLLKDFMEARLFEGLRVSYYRSTKAKIAGDDPDVRGVITGTGILCFCNKCRGTEVVTPHVFEIHAFSSNKRPPEYIFLENGKSLRDVMNACKDVPLDAIVEIIRKATNSAPQPREAAIKSIRFSHARVDQITPGPRVAAISYADWCAVQPDSVEPHALGKSKGSSATSKPGGKITLKNLNLHKAVFEEDVLPDGTEVTYVANKEVLRRGYKSGSGICCDCCNKVISPSQFEAHAGRASHRKPFHNIFTSNGVSLHELAVSLRKLNMSSVTINDDLCYECRRVGDLISCAGCPRSFHKECAHSLSKLDGTWYCRQCESDMKENHINANALAAGRVPGIDSIEQIVNRTIRIINIGEVEIGGCILCRDTAFTKEFGPLTVIICDQCEREYHVGCLMEKGMADLMREPEGDWFCCQECQRIHSSLHKLVAKGEERLPDFLLGNIKSKAKPSNESVCGSSFVVKFRILSGRMASEENRPLLSTAVDILRENFGHIVDPGTNTDLIPAMVNGEELKIQDFRGMYCAVLTVNSTVVSAGVFRIRGQELAEMPLVATSSQAQGQGYFQTLYACIERFFGFVKVQKIMLPAANGAEAIWTKKFGFSQMTEEELKPFMETYHLMNFQGLPWFKKTVPKIRIKG